VGGKQRSFIAIQILAPTSIKVNVTYKGKTARSLRRTRAAAIRSVNHPRNAKRTRMLNTALGAGLDGPVGLLTGRTFGRGVVIERHPDNPTAKFVAIVRGQNPGAGEDYNGMPVHKTSN